MDGKLRSRMEEILAAMSPKEQRGLTREADQRRREAGRVARASGRKGLRGGGPQPTDPAREWMLALLAERHAHEERREDRFAVEQEVTLLGLSRGWCDAMTDEGEPLTCALPVELPQAIAVGDRARVGQREGGRWELAAVLPRTSRLSRPDPQDPLRERVLVANIDLVLIVCAAASPPLRPGLVDRLLVAIAMGGARPMLVVNKIDLAPPELDELLAPYEALGLPVLRVSVRTGQGIDALRERLAGQLCAFVGHSGVGKSSLVNALDPEARILTGEVNERIGRGRHTTTATKLHRLAGGVRIIDTPGVRSFGLWRVEPAQAAAFFPEIAEIAGACRYRDCLHDGEDGCAVDDAVETGTLAPARLAGYRRILGSLRLGPPSG